MGGGNSKHHPDTIEKIRAAKSGANAYNYGKHISEEQKQKTRETWRKKKEQGIQHGTKESKERFENIRELGALACIKPVGQYDKDGNLIKRFESSLCVTQEYGYNRRNVTKACRLQEKYHGFFWKYLPKENTLT